MGLTKLVVLAGLLWAVVAFRGTFNVDVLVWMPLFTVPPPGMQITWLALMKSGFAMWLWDAKLPQFVPKRYAIPLSVSPRTTIYVRSPLEQTVCDCACALPTFRPRVMHKKSTPSIAATLNFPTKLTALYCWKILDLRHCNDASASTLRFSSGSKKDFQTCWCIRKITFPLDYNLQHSQVMLWCYITCRWIILPCIQKHSYQPLRYSLPTTHSRQSSCIFLIWMQGTMNTNTLMYQRQRLHSISHTKWVILTQFGI